MGRRRGQETLGLIIFVNDESATKPVAGRLIGFLHKPVIPTLKYERQTVDTVESAVLEKGRISIEKVKKVDFSFDLCGMQFYVLA